jgi:hypothetical protein
MNNRTRCTVLGGLFMLGAALSACGGDDDDATGSGGSGGSGTGGAGTGGQTTGGSGGSSAGTGGGAGTGGSAGATGGDPCAIHCAAAAMLHCEADPADCTTACEDLREMRESMCSTEAEAYYECLGTTEVADYYCNDLYFTALRSDDCLVQEDALFACTG